MTQLVKNTAKIIGGTAVAGIGFSLGRDIYRKLKKNYLILIAIVVIMLAIYGCYSSGLWLGRNYQSRVKSIFVRLGGILAVAVCLMSSLAFFYLFAAVFYCSYYDLACDKLSEADEMHIQFYSTTPGILSFIIGCVVGIYQHIKTYARVGY